MLDREQGICSPNLSLSLLLPLPTFSLLDCLSPVKSRGEVHLKVFKKHCVTVGSPHLSPELYFKVLSLSKQADLESRPLRIVLHVFSDAVVTYSSLLTIYTGKPHTPVMIKGEICHYKSLPIC